MQILKLENVTTESKTLQSHNDFAP